MKSLIKRGCHFLLRKSSQVLSFFIFNKRNRKLCREFFDERIINLYSSDIKAFVDQYPNVWSEEDTIKNLIKNRSSICRFGDGEFKLILGENHKAFQDHDVRLIEHLRAVLQSNQPNILIGINNIKKAKSIGRVWSKFIIRLGQPVLQLLDENRVYPSSGVFRQLPADDSDKFVNRVNLIKEVWNDRKILFVVGANSRFKYEEELFSNAKSIDYVYGPAKNAFMEYDDIYNKILAYEKTEYLVIVVLGPTATIMVYDLAMDGYQAIDFGQMPTTYRRAKKEIFGDADFSLNELDS